MHNPINKTDDAIAFGRDLMRLSADREEQDKALGALFRAMVFGVEPQHEDDNKQPA